MNDIILFSVSTSFLLQIIQHYDVKPDNWVLTSSPKGEDYAGTNAVAGADLMLVDFGRSIDLEKSMHRGSNPLRSQFEGSIAAEDMECD